MGAWGVLVRDDTDGGRPPVGAPGATVPVLDPDEVAAPSLDIRLGDGSRGRLLRRHREFRIGRDLDNDLRVDDPSVSRHHVRLVPCQDGWDVLNDSSSGMLVDGRPAERHRLRGAAVIALGRHPEAPRVLVVPCDPPVTAFPVG